jgi:hypothetical protein
MQTREDDFFHSEFNYWLDFYDYQADLDDVSSPGNTDSDSDSWPNFDSPITASTGTRAQWPSPGTTWPGYRQLHPSNRVVQGYSP